jgi:hypothetical protein
MITRLKLSTIEQGLPKYRSMLAGNSAYVPPAFESIASATVGSAGTVEFTSIPQTYKSLQIRFTAKDGDGGNTADIIRVTFNNVGGTSYAYHQLWGNGSSASVNAVDTTSRIQVRAANASTTSAFSGGIIDIHDYASTTRNKTLRAFCGVDNNTASTNYEVALTSGLFNSTNAITSIKLEHSANSNFSTGTNFALYGIKG